MNSKPRSVCIIPARGGSKRIPRKNILKLNGLPLLTYSIRSVLRAQVFDEIVVSSEDSEILQLALDEGVQIDKRPEGMAGDHITKVQVVMEYIKRKNLQFDYDIIAAALPTCPFRTADDVKNAYRLFISNSVINHLISVVEYDFPIQLALEVGEKNVMTPVFKDGYEVTRSQDIGKRYHPNGAIYIASIDSFLRKSSFFDNEMLTYVMPSIRSFDIDYPYQFEIAEVLARKIKANEL